MTSANIFCVLVGFMGGGLAIWPIAHAFGAQAMATEFTESMRKLRDARRAGL